jgi:hypothetical protein
LSNCAKPDSGKCSPLGQVAVLVRVDGGQLANDPIDGACDLDLEVDLVGVAAVGHAFGQPLHKVRIRPAAQDGPLGRDLPKDAGRVVAGDVAGLPLVRVALVVRHDVAEGVTDQARCALSVELVPHQLAAPLPVVCYGEGHPLVLVELST